MTTYNLKDQHGATWIRCTQNEAAAWIRRFARTRPNLTFTLQVQ